MRQLFLVGGAVLMALVAGPLNAGSLSALSGEPPQSGDSQTSVWYSPTTGELSVDAPAGKQLTSINIDSAACIFTGAPAENLGGDFDNDTDCNIFKATFGSSFGSLSFGNVAQPGLSVKFLINDLTVLGSLAGGGGLGPVDGPYIPERSSLLLALVGIIGLLHWRCLGKEFLGPDYWRGQFPQTAVVVGITQR